MNFDSGWEWGYWLNDVVTARASWDPLLSPRVYEHVKKEKEKTEGEEGEGGDRCGEEEEEGFEKLSGDKASMNISQPQCTHASPSTSTPSSSTSASSTTATGSISSISDPTHPTHPSETDPYTEKQDQWTAFALSLTPITRIFGTQLGPKLAHILVTTAQKQADVLLFGRVNGQDSPDLTKLSGE